MGSLVVGTIYFGLMFILAGFFLLLGLCFNSKLKEFLTMAGGIVVLFVVVIPLNARLSLKIQEAEERPIKEAAEKRYNEAKAVFDEQCKKAGEKIYRTVDNVDGIMLLKVWRENDDSDGYGYHRWVNDQMWEYAGYITAGGKYYIGSFLSKDKEHFLGGDFFDGIGYQYVDIPNNGQFIHYTGMFNGENFVGDEEIILNSSARYVVTFETDINPELRKYWVAGVTFKIIDLQTNELLAEKTIFNFSQTLGKRIHGLSWVADNLTCGTDGKLFRAFVFSVLKPSL